MSVNPTYVLAELYPKDRNLKARWFIQYGIFDTNKGKIIYEQKRVPSRLKTVREREQWAKKAISQINTLLIEGFVKDTSLREKEIELNKSWIIEPTLDECLGIKTTHLRSSSRKAYEVALKKFKTFLVNENLQGIQIKQFKPEHCHKFRKHIIEEHKNSNRTANNNIIWIKALFELAKDFGRIDENPFKLTPLIETDSNINATYTPEHQKILEDYLKEYDPILYLFTRFVYYAFIRPKELRQLTGTHLNLSKNTITITGAIAKNRRTEQIPIHPILRKNIGVEVLELPNKYLFGKNMCWLNNTPCSVNYVYERHKKALEACELTNLGYTLYSWKHTGVWRAVEAGVNIRRLQGLLRHKSLEETDSYLKSIGIVLESESIKEMW